MVDKNLNFQEKVRSQFFSRVAADKEKKLVEQILYLPPQLASFAHAFPWLLKAQTLVKGFRVEGNKVVFPLKIGKFNGSCIPGLRPFLWKEVSIEGKFVKIVLEGIGGAASTFLPMVTSGAAKVEMDKRIGDSKGVKRSEILTCTTYYPALKKVIVGIDDTDTSTKGDTYLTAIEIGQNIESHGYAHYIKESMTMNYPLNPFKTTNNASSSMVFLVKPSQKKKLIEESIQETQELSISRDTGLAIFEGIDIPKSIIEYSKRCKAKMLQVSDAEEAARSAGVRLINTSDGDRGKIGALSSIGYVNDPIGAIAPSFKFRMLFKLGNTYVKIKDLLSKS